MDEPLGAMTGAPVRAKPKPASAQRQGNAPLEPRRKQSVGEHWPQPLLQRDARKRADNSVDLISVADHDEQRNRLRDAAEPRAPRHPISRSRARLDASPPRR